MPWMSAPSPMISPNLEGKLLQLDEVWIWDDTRQDWATFQMIGDDMSWVQMVALLDGARTAWDAVAFFVGLGAGGPLIDSVARNKLRDIEASVTADPLALNRGMFFDRLGRHLRIDDRPLRRQRIGGRSRRRGDDQAVGLERGEGGSVDRYFESHGVPGGGLAGADATGAARQVVWRNVELVERQVVAILVVVLDAQVAILDQALRHHQVVRFVADRELIAQRDRTTDIGRGRQERSRTRAPTPGANQPGRQP